MSLFQNGQLNIGSGILGSETMVAACRVTNVSISTPIPRANVNVLNRGKPLEQRPVINYVPVDFSCDSYFSDKSFETNVGLINSTGITAAIVDTKAASATYGVRNMQVLFSPTNSNYFNGGRDLKSGVLSSYALKGGISEPVTRSVSMQFLDMSGYILNTSRPAAGVAGFVRPEGAFLTGIQFSGYGVSGVNIQSFSLTVSFTRAATNNMGQRFPVERPLTDVTATLQVQGYIDGFNNVMSGLGQYNAGSPTYETVGLTLYPACSTSAPMTVTMINPYLDNETINPQIGNFATVSYSFSLPIGPNPYETGDGSRLIMM